MLSRTIALAAVCLCGVARAQSDQGAERATELAEQGRCAEAMPLIKGAMGQVADQALAKRMGAAAVRCAMMQNHQKDATSFVAWLEEKFPRDPEVLFMATHVYMDLSRRSEDELSSVAPDSPLVVELNAENFLRHGEFRKAIDEYRILLQRAPNMPGIHYRIGQLILQLPATATSSADARKEFEEELKIYPQNAGAEYFLGEISRENGDLPAAIQHYSQATKLNAGLPEPYFGLGRSLLESGRPAEAVPPLETAARLSPENPTVHLTLAHAYQKLGRRADAAREFELQKNTAAKIQRNTTELKQNVSGMNAPQADSK
jgi:predicted Zn-dependent protease